MVGRTPQNQLEGVLDELLDLPHFVGRRVWPDQGHLRRLGLFDPCLFESVEELQIVGFDPREPVALVLRLPVEELPVPFEQPVVQIGDLP